jgi:glycosyltransferase involved in cell wall biosynthesis
MRSRLLGEHFHLIAFVVGAHGLDSTLIRNLAREHTDILFVMVNRYIPSRLSGERKDIMTDLPNVKFMYNVSEEDMIAIYESADLFFRPLQFATANNAVLEAMAMAKPILVHKLPGVTDYVDSSTAYLAESDEDFYVQFRHAVDHPEERQQKGCKARKMAEQEFAWEHVVRRTLEIYTAVGR